MNVRNELAKLRQQTNQIHTNGDVKAISDLMDELSIEAAGGGVLRQQSSLQDVFDEASSSPIRSEQ
jgi:hypothetical protein